VWCSREHQITFEYPQAVSGMDMRDSGIPMATVGEAAVCVRTRWDGSGMLYSKD
jgi:hypothetical protein